MQIGQINQKGKLVLKYVGNSRGQMEQRYVWSKYYNKDPDFTYS